jgi:hypothetical protein
MVAFGVAGWLGGYQDLIWGMRWLLSPALLATMTLVMKRGVLPLAIRCVWAYNGTTSPFPT